jgi:hypothetical protein
MGRPVRVAVLNTRVVNLTAHPAIRVPNPERLPCDGAVFRDDYARCTNTAIKRRGKWKLCAPHARKDELEIVVDNEPTIW